VSILNIIEGVALAFLLTSILFIPAILTRASQRRRAQVLIALGFTALFAALSALTLDSWSQEDWSTAKPKSLKDELGVIGIYLASASDTSSCASHTGRTPCSSERHTPPWRCAQSR
jgi:hypothetical protein